MEVKEALEQEAGGARSPGREHNLVKGPPPTTGLWFRDTSKPNLTPSNPPRAEILIQALGHYQ